MLCEICGRETGWEQAPVRQCVRGLKWGSGGVAKDRDCLQIGYERAIAQRDALQGVAAEAVRVMAERDAARAAHEHDKAQAAAAMQQLADERDAMRAERDLAQGRERAAADIWRKALLNTAAGRQEAYDQLAATRKQSIADLEESTTVIDYAAERIDKLESVLRDCANELRNHAATSREIEVLEAADAALEPDMEPRE